MAKTWATKCCSGTYKNNYQLCCGIKGYQEVMQNLDDAITLLNNGTAKDTGLSGAVGSKDLIYGSNTSTQASMWLKTAYALKARYTMRLLNKSANKTTDLQNILTYVSKSFANASEECKFAPFTMLIRN